MKKLFVAALGALMAISMAACNSTPSVEDFSDEVIADGSTVYGMVGPGCAYIDGEPIAKAWGDADATQGVAKAISLRDVAKKDVKVANSLKKKGVKGLYMVDKVELGHQAIGGYMKGAYDEKGNYVERDGVFTVKFAKFAEDEDTGKKFIDTWIPSPEAYSESLTPATFWAPIHQEEKDAHGLAHDSDAVNLGGAGEYTYVLAVYKKAVKGSFFGIAVFKDQELTPYVAPADRVIYSMPGAWNGWNNAAEMEKVSDTEYTMLLENVAADANGRVTETGSWTTVADYTNVTEGADLVVDDNGGDHNFKFVAAGTYRVTLHINGDAKTLSIVANA